MATRSRQEGPVSYSVLDRLLDVRDDEKLDIDRQNSRSKSVAYFKHAVRRDLEWLLNSRTPLELPHGPESERSLYTYGLPDVNSLSLLSHRDRQILTKAIQVAIQKFEPRIRNPRVVLVTDGDQRVQSIRFIIEGILHMEPNPEPIAFDMGLDLTSGQYKIPGDNGAG
jgi:type VI secretion system protein ImpF